MLAHVVRIIHALSLPEEQLFSLFTVITLSFVKGMRPKGRVKLRKRLIESTNKICVPVLTTNVFFLKSLFVPIDLF